MSSQHRSDSGSVSFQCWHPELHQSSHQRLSQFKQTSEDVNNLIKQKSHKRDKGTVQSSVVAIIYLPRPLSMASVPKRGCSRHRRLSANIQSNHHSGLMIQPGSDLTSLAIHAHISPKSQRLAFCQAAWLFLLKYRFHPLSWNSLNAAPGCHGDRSRSWQATLTKQEMGLKEWEVVAVTEGLDDIQRQRVHAHVIVLTWLYLCASLCGTCQSCILTDLWSWNRGSDETKRCFVFY